MNDIHIEEYEKENDIHFIKSKQRTYLILRFICTAFISAINVFQMYVIPDVEEVHVFWLLMAIF